MRNLIIFLLAAMTAFAQPVVTGSVSTLTTNNGFATQSLTLGSGIAYTASSGSSLTSLTGSTINLTAGTVSLSALSINNAIGGESISFSTVTVTSLVGVSPTLTLTGAITGSTSFTNLASGTLNTILAANGVTTGTYGSATAAPIVYVLPNGTVSYAGTVTIAPAFASITATPTTLGGYGIANAQTLSGPLTALSALGGPGLPWFVNATTSSLLVLTNSAVVGTTNTGSMTVYTLGGGLVLSGGVLNTVNSGTVVSASLSAGTTGLTITGVNFTTAPSFTLSGTLALASGGTSATTSTAALGNLGAFGVGLNNTVTGTTTLSATTISSLTISGPTSAQSISATFLTLSTPMSVAQGGTGGTTYASGLLLLGNGTSALSSTSSWPSSSLSGTLAAAQFPALTGDVTTPVGALTATLATVNTAVGTFGTASNSTTFVVNGKGLITSVSANIITPAAIGSPGLTSSNSFPALTVNTFSGTTVFGTGLTNLTGLHVTTVTLASGVATVTLSNITANTAVVVSRISNNGSSALGSYTVSLSSGSYSITAVSSTASTVTGDTSELRCLEIITP